MSKRSGADLMRERIKKQKQTTAGTCSTTNRPPEPKAPPKPRTPTARKVQMFEQSVASKDAERTFPTAADWGRLMVKCFWHHFATFDPLANVGTVLQREEPSFSEGVLRFLKKDKGTRLSPALQSKAVEKEVDAYRTARRQELHQKQREHLRSEPAVGVRAVPRHSAAPTPPAAGSQTEDVPSPMPPERSVVGKQRDCFYNGAALEVGSEAFDARAAADGVTNKLMCGEVVFAISPTATAAGSMGSYRHDRHGPWAHSGAGSQWADVFVPSLDRIAQRDIQVGGRTPLFAPAPPVAEGVEHLHLIKIGEGKYSQIFAPSNTLAADKPADLSGWPPMLVRLDKNGVRRARNVAVRVPRINRDDRANDDGSMAYAHEEATNLCEAAVAGFGPSLLAAFFLPDPDPPSHEDHPRRAFRFITVMNRQSASLDQRSRTSALAALNPFTTTKPAALAAHAARYLTMLLDTVFEYSARQILYLDAGRSNFMDEEAAFRANVNAEALGAVKRVNVIDLDPRFYRRLDGATPESVWLFNITLVLAHMRRVDAKQRFMPKMMQTSLHGGMTLGDLLCKVYAEQKRNPGSAWLFSIPWDQLPPQWAPDLASEWQTSIGAQMQQVVGYYFFYAERDGNGRKALDMYDKARYRRNQQAVESARARLQSSYIAGGGMHAARHFLYAAKDTAVPSLVHALFLYVDAETLLKHPGLLSNEPYAKPVPLPRMGEPLGDVDGHLGLNLMSASKQTASVFTVAKPRLSSLN
jgi:hypothetical protein